MFALLVEYRGELFGDELFADLLPSGWGRPTVPVEVMTTVITLQVVVGPVVCRTVSPEAPVNCWGTLSAGLRRSWRAARGS